MWFLSVKILYKFNAFSIFIKHVSFTVAVTFGLNYDSKNSMDFFYFLTVSWIGNLFLP